MIYKYKNLSKGMKQKQGWKKLSGAEEFAKKNETFVQRWTPSVKILNIKRNFNRATPIYWFFLLSLALIIIGSIFSFLRIFLWTGIFMIFIFIVYFIVFVIFKR